MRFATDTDGKQGDTCWLQKLHTDFFYARIQALMSLWDKCLDIDSDCVEFWCVPSATYVPCTDESQDMVLGIGVFLLVFLNFFVFAMNLIFLVNKS
jgi:hypothetical protein